ncbi:hypothetical protein BRC95_08995 [Halobacteriales archaeon QS_5_68_33]|nr:MAG: hypothetical protein BRC95_08995 [Halobacteriales archaeon QS_5_68_33]
MNRRNTLGTALVVLAVVLFVVPAVFPAQPVLIHDTDRTTRDSPSSRWAPAVTCSPRRVRSRCCRPRGGR